jgi:hypothetical protein
MTIWVIDKRFHANDILSGRRRSLYRRATIVPPGVWAKPKTEGVHIVSVCQQASDYFLYPLSSEGLYGFVIECSLWLHNYIPNTTPRLKSKAILTFWTSAFSATPLLRGIYYVVRIRKLIGCPYSPKIWNLKSKIGRRRRSKRRATFVPPVSERSRRPRVCEYE